MNISDEGVEAAAKATYSSDGLNAWALEDVSTHNHYRRKARAILEAAAPHLMAHILSLCDEAETRRGSSMYCKLTTYEVRKALGAAE